MTTIPKEERYNKITKITTTTTATKLMIKPNQN